MENVFHKCLLFKPFRIFFSRYNDLLYFTTFWCHYSLVNQPVFLVIFSLIYKHQNVHFLIQMKKAQKIACCEVLLTGIAKEI